MTRAERGYINLQVGIGISSDCEIVLSSEKRKSLLWVPLRGKDKPPSAVVFAPDAPLWGELASVKRADNHLFVRYAFENSKEQQQKSVRKEV